MKVAVLTDPEAAAGYRLAGLQVEVARDPAAAREVLAHLVQSEDYALVAVDLALLPDPYQAVKREMRGRALPILLPVPSARGAFAGEDAAGYMRRLIKETMGYEINI